MKQKLTTILALVGAAAILFGAGLLWQQRPWRPAVVVNGHALTAEELGQRAGLLLEDAQRSEHLIIPESRRKEALRHFAREAAKMWIVKEVFLNEAMARGVEVTPEDEKRELARAQERLKTKNLTLEQFYKMGPLPEEVKRRDFREGILVAKFTEKEIVPNVSVTPKEVDERLAEMQRLALARTKPGEKPTVRPTRQMARDSLRAERYRIAFRKMFRSLYAKAEVKSTAFPDLGTLNGVSPERPEDKQPPAAKPAAPAAKPAAPVAKPAAKK